MSEEAQGFERLVAVMNDLREKCPWDKKQTFQTLRPLTIEELYELVQAIDEENYTDIKEELGDVLLHIVFYSKMAEEKQQFTISDVLNTIVNKLIERHPHIYGNIVANTEEEVKKNWEKIKLQSNPKKTVLSGVPKAAPAVIKATRIQEKAKQVGFEWENKEDVWAKLQEELAELQQATAFENKQAIEEELGDVLFSIINYARFIGVDAEAALEKTNQKFIKRFNYIEKKATAQGQQLYNMSLAEMDVLWNEAKTQQLD
ncbi:MAG: nucleoside triphosphate pyrophosphohydrolase [Chitinophagaceae bacterium]